MATYKESGVDIDAADESVDRIKGAVRKTFTPGVLADIGAFGAFFEPDLSGYEQPVLVSSIDGVGTKVLVAKRAGRFDTVGQDLVNHCVNDIASCGAEPLFFLDYYATGTLNPDHAEALIGGFAAACQSNGCALIGGEIAEMPDVYAADDFDLAGTIVGMVDKADIIDGSAVQAGDVLLGLPSTGLHTNGFSLARHVLFDAFAIDEPIDALGGTSLAEALLTVHRSYLPAIRAARKAVPVHGIAHITGGGLPGNLARIMPDGLHAQVDYTTWTRPAIFDLIQDVGDVPESDMRRTFNLGIGLVVAVPPSAVADATQALTTGDVAPVRIGTVQAN
ncbi:phosphoribosylformylglycinamidine cyclo-ligase [Longimonas halophila]|uniref:Phosphoribosylformylglycinamidine cyclo-ligase n=1 Tax=Longimonas halophila TaxID=1469170 RepID=A0A2H3P4J5_9BACT|nr:phosphoribosylformylglycinamidine cyclo-ligase [Longimonas halophila]PEN09439.1 phosphoribosylformylglycinamidine cyclo-ligase [Longimonas halophila]